MSSSVIFYSIYGESETEQKTTTIPDLHRNDITTKHVLRLLNRIKILAPTRVDPKRVKRVLLITTHRSGSSFLGELLQQSDPLSYYVYEPLRSLPPGNKTYEAWMSDAVYLMRNLFTCNYDAIPQYNDYNRNNPGFFRRNQVIGKVCATRRKIPPACSDGRISTEMCLRSRVQIIKTTRLGVADIPKLDLPTETKIVYLQRDPRAIYNSRKPFAWCEVDRCLNISAFCREREDDLRALKQWPTGTITLIRYEDLANNPLEESKRLFEQLGLSYTKHVESFVKEHTTDASETKNRFSTYRNSSAAIGKWKTELNAREIAEIQKRCHYTLKHAGYEFM